MNPFDLPKNNLHAAFRNSKIFWEAMSIQQLENAINNQEKAGNEYIVRELQKILDKKKKNNKNAKR